MPGARRQNALSLLFFLAIGIAFMVRFAISPQLVNMVMHYTSEGGSFFEKLHFGTYAIFLLLPVVLFSRPFRLAGDEIGKFRALVRFAAVMLLLVGYMILTGRTSSSGFIIDTYLAAGAAALLMLALHADLRRALGDLTLAMLILSAVIGIGEAVTRHRLLPYGFVELQFRPTGLSQHPLELGALCATAIGFVVLTRWRIWVRVAMVFVLFIGCAASGARFALLLAVAEILALLLFVPWPRLAPRDARRAKLVVLVLTGIGGAGLFGLLAASGLISRFGHSLFDENFMARVTIYRVFEFVDWKEIMAGMNADALLAVVNQRLNLPYIESAPVVIILLLGLPLALVFIVSVFWMLLRLLRQATVPAWIGTIVFVLAALSNNTLSSKTAVIAIIFVLIVAYAPAGTRPGPAD